MSRSDAHVKWAQRKDVLYITVEVADPSEIVVDFTDQQIVLRGKGKTKVAAESGSFATTLQLSRDLSATGHSHKVLGHSVQIHARKAVPEHWEKLTAEASKATKSWLTVDWALWKDEDEETAEDRLDFGGGGYGNLGNMLNSAGTKPDDADDEGDERPPADLSDLGV